MAAKTTLNAKNLEALGAPRLAELLIEISTGSAAHKRRLRMELAGNHSSAEVAREIRKRLSSMARARTIINWRKVKATRADLENQRRAIVETVAPDDPAEAFELIWQFLAMADPLFERSDDGSGSLVESFHQACTDAGAIAQAANIEIDVLGQKILKAVQNNGYGQFDTLIAGMVQPLGKRGLEHLKALFVGWSNEPEEKADREDRRIIGWGTAGPVYEDDVYGNQKSFTVRIALQQIADAQGDVDAYIAQQPEITLGEPLVAADIASRLVASGRAQEALAALNRAGTKDLADIPREWQIGRTEALEALGRTEEAQAFRWQCFEQTLNGEHLRAFLRRLPDFDDIEAEEKAFAYVHALPDVQRALLFFLHWPSLAEASKLVTERAAELDGNFYELMTPASEALSAKFPLAATIVLRSMIDFALTTGRSSRYRHAARHLAECRSLASQIEDFRNIQPHQAYVEELMREHGRKSGFWSLVPS